MPRSETGRSSRYAESRVVLAPSRSWTLAASTTTTMSKAQGVGDDEPLPAVDLLAGVVTTAVASDGVRALDALRVDDPGAGLGIAALLHPGLLRSAASITSVTLACSHCLKYQYTSATAGCQPAGTARRSQSAPRTRSRPQWTCVDASSAGRPSSAPAAATQPAPTARRSSPRGTAAVETPGHPDGIDVHVTQTRRPRSKNFSNTL